MLKCPFSHAQVPLQPCPSAASTMLKCRFNYAQVPFRVLLKASDRNFSSFSAKDLVG
jgi:hypothetical protein